MKKAALELYMTSIVTNFFQRAVPEGAPNYSLKTKIEALVPHLNFPGMGKVEVEENSASGSQKILQTRADTLPKA